MQSKPNRSKHPLIVHESKGNEANDEYLCNLRAHGIIAGAERKNSRKKIDLKAEKI